MNKFYWFIIIILIMILSWIISVKVVYGANFVDTFETYATGTVNVVTTDWTYNFSAKNYMSISDLYPINGSKSILSTTSNQTAGIDFNYSTTSLEIGWYAKIYASTTKPDINSYYCFLIEIDTNDIINFCIDKTGITANGGGAIVYNFTSENEVLYRVRLNTYTKKFSLLIDDYEYIDNNDYLGSSTVSGSQVKISLYTAASCYSKTSIDDFYVTLSNDFTVPDGYTPIESSCLLGTDCAEISVPVRYICNINENCEIPYLYNEFAINGDIYFVYSDDYDTYLEDYLFYTSIPDGDGYDTIWHLETATGSKDFCFVLVTPTYNVKSYCTSIIFEEEDVIIFPDRGWTCEDPCYGIATSSSWWEGEITYNLKCFPRELNCYFLHPATSSVLQIKQTIKGLESQFPFSIGYQMMSVFRDKVQTGLGSTTGSTTIDIPLKVGTIDLGTYINGDTFHALGDDIFDKYWFLMESLIYIFTGMYLTFRILQL